MLYPFLTEDEGFEMHIFSLLGSSGSVVHLYVGGLLTGFVIKNDIKENFVQLARFCFI